MINRPRDKEVDESFGCFLRRFGSIDVGKRIHAVDNQSVRGNLIGWNHLGGGEQTFVHVVC